MKLFLIVAGSIVMFLFVNIFGYGKLKNAQSFELDGWKLILVLEVLATISTVFVAFLLSM